jgi:hypothetical protein
LLFVFLILIRLFIVVVEIFVFVVGFSGIVVFLRKTLCRRTREVEVSPLERIVNVVVDSHATLLKPNRSIWLPAARGAT